MSRIAGLVLLTLAGLAWAGGPAGPVRIDFDAVLLGPSAKHWLGTDHLGRDLLVRLVAGSKPALQAVAAALVGAVGAGVLGGAILALGPPSLQRGMGVMADLALATPTLVAALILSAALGGGPLATGLALAVTGWAPYALTIAALAARLRTEAYWQAALALGVGPARGFARHLLPQLAGPLGALAGADAGRAVVLAASLGFLGLGSDTGAADWGAMIHEYRLFLFEAPRLLLTPVAAIAVLSLGLHLALDAPQRPAFR